MDIAEGKKIYFLSDFHLGAPDLSSSLVRERKIVKFLESARKDAQVIFLVGDLFDFWYEYRQVVPKGYVRLLGKLAELTDAGISIYLFVGNHDMWMRNYFQEELGITVYFEPKEFRFDNKLFLVGHGDGLGPGDHGYKALKKVFRNPVSQFLFGVLPPYIGIGLANFFSRKSREATGIHEEIFRGAENEWLITYCKERLAETAYDFMVFGHRHLPIDFSFENGSRYINLGDWIRYFTYATFDGNSMSLQSAEPSLENKIVRS